MNTLQTHKKSIGIALIALFVGIGIGYASAGSNRLTRGIDPDQNLRGGFTGNPTDFQNGMMRGGTARGGVAMTGGFLSGIVSAKDTNSITLTTPGGSSRVIVLTPSTTISKSTDTTLADIPTGSSITVTGTTNSDGSVTATQLQIRPTGTTTPKN